MQDITEEEEVIKGIINQIQVIVIPQHNKLIEQLIKNLMILNFKLKMIVKYQIGDNINQNKIITIKIMKIIMKEGEEQKEGEDKVEEEGEEEGEEEINKWVEKENRVEITTDIETMNFKIETN